jgi:tRNA threonylcarbamoyladenosine biosynthesis protein TsaE
MLELVENIDGISSYIDSISRNIAEGKRKIFLKGPLGAGKTAFVKILGGKLGVSEDVLSPSFQLIRRYRTETGCDLVHIDLYRLCSEREIMGIGWDDILSEDSVLAVEWADRAPGIIPEDELYISLSFTEDDDIRRLRVFTDKNEFLSD